MTRLLLDTQILLWMAYNPKRLSQKLLETMAKDVDRLFFSAISVWEVAIKSARNRPDFEVDAAVFRAALLERGFVELDFTSSHAVAAGSLPPHHSDPFDRALIAQAQVESLNLLTTDKAIRRYSEVVTLA